QDFAARSAAGDVSLVGNIHYHAVGSDPLLRDISIDGRLASDAVTAAASGSRVELRRLEGTYQLAGGNLEVRNVSVDSLGGRITANAEVRHLDTTPESHVRAALHNISLGAAQRALRGTET